MDGRQPDPDLLRREWRSVRQHQDVRVHLIQFAPRDAQRRRWLLDHGGGRARYELARRHPQGAAINVDADAARRLPGRAGRYERPRQRHRRSLRCRSESSRFPHQRGVGRAPFADQDVDAVAAREPGPDPHAHAGGVHVPAEDVDEERTHEHRSADHDPDDDLTQVAEPQPDAREQREFRSRLPERGEANSDDPNEREHDPPMIRGQHDAHPQRRIEEHNHHHYSCLAPPAHGRMLDPARLRGKR